jgi:hypothetical protein
LLDFTPDQTGAIPADQITAFTTWRAELPYSIDLALGAATSSSSVRSGGFTDGVLTDGVLKNDGTTYLQTWFSANSGDLNPWAEIDLSASRWIGRIEVFNINFARNTGGQMRDLTVTVYDNSRNVVYSSGTLNAANAAYGGSYFLGPGQITLSPLVTGRYVRVQRAGTGSTTNEQQLALDEIQVFAPASSVIHGGQIQVSGNVTVF